MHGALRTCRHTTSCWLHQDIGIRVDCMACMGCATTQERGDGIAAGSHALARVDVQAPPAVIKPLAAHRHHVVGRKRLDKGSHLIDPRLLGHAMHI